MDALHTNEEVGSKARRVVRLTIEPSRLDAAAKNCRLTLRVEQLTEGNAAIFYGKAVRGLKALLPECDIYSVWDWTETPLIELPQVRVQAILDQAKASLDWVSKGARCANCKWRRSAPETTPRDLSMYHRLAYLLCVRARVEIAQRQYERALETIRTGLSVAKHVGEAPKVVRGIMGIGIAALMVLPVEDLAQAKGSPNLYAAIHALPRSLVDLEVSISSEPKPERARMKDMLEPAFERTRMLMRRLDANAAALECIEALRHFAAGHDGSLPEQLSDITDIQVPNDPATGRPLAYRIEGSRAILETSVPKGGTPRDSTHYEISVAR